MDNTGLDWRGEKYRLKLWKSNKNEERKWKKYEIFSGGKQKGKIQINKLKKKAGKKRNFTIWGGRHIFE